MRASPKAFPALAFMAALALAGCSGDSAEDDGSGGTTAANCGGRGETYSAMMTKPGESGALTFILVSSEPPPPQKFINVWTLEVRQGDTPVEGATISVTTLMSDHDHPGEPAVVVTELAEPGRYELNPVNLAMKGLWTINITATSADGTADHTAFNFCVEG